MEITKKTWLPIFKGFYNTCYENDDYLMETELDSCLLDRLDKDAFKWLCNNFYAYIDYEQFRVEFAKAYCRQLSTDNITFEYACIRSPKEYNFANDSIDVTCKIKDFNVIKDYILNNIADFKKYITESYTSCSGFWSSYSNDVNDWLTIIDNAQNESLEHELGSILQFYILHQSQDDDVDFCVYENIACNGSAINSYIDYEKMINDFNENFETNFKSISDLVECGSLETDKIASYYFLKTLQYTNLRLF